jgi:hypothetical protein
MFFFYVFKGVGGKRKEVGGRNRCDIGVKNVVGEPKMQISFIFLFFFIFYIVSDIYVNFFLFTI